MKEIYVLSMAPEGARGVGLFLLCMLTIVVVTCIRDAAKEREASK